MPDKRTRGISNLPVAIPDVPDAPTVSAVNVGTALGLTAEEIAALSK